MEKCGYDKNFREDCAECLVNEMLETKIYIETSFLKYY